MISRRNIRVKVMQTLYTLAAGESSEASLKAAPEAGRKLLAEKLERSLELFTTLILYIIRIAQYAETDAQMRRNKYLPTAEDLKVSTRIAGNAFLLAILNNASFKEKVKAAKLERFVDADWLKKQHNLLAKTDEYQAYIQKPEPDKQDEKAIILYIWQELLWNSADAQEHFSDELAGWEDDKEMMGMLMDNFFRQPIKVNFLNLLGGEKKEYAYALLETTLDKEDYAMELIKPKLQNWDAERVAQIDLLLMRMGVCELLYFQTIPTKVTINEYIEVAKHYSTPQSGHFVNGVLDSILKDLVRDGIVNKAERYIKK